MLVKVKVFPKEKQNAVVKKNNDAFEVKTTAYGFILKGLFA